MKPADIIFNTPIWVWALLCLLLFLGIRALRPTTSPLWRVGILPAVFFVWGLYSLVMLYGLTLARAAPGPSRWPAASSSAC